VITGSSRPGADVCCGTRNQECKVKIVGDGFLSAHGISEARRISKEISPIVDLVQGAIRLCHISLLRIDVNAQETDVEKQKIISSVVLARLLEISESIVLLANGGFSTEVTAGLRNFLEAYFIFGNLCSNAEFVTEYFKTDLRARQKIINAAAPSKNEIYEKVNLYATENVRSELKSEIEELKATEANCYEYARRIECTETYNVFYRIASAATHSTPRSLEAYVIENEAGDVTEIRRMPQLSKIPDNLITVGLFLLNSCEGYNKLFGNDISVETNQLRIAFEAIDL
jgi:hypothetical protein